MHQMRDAAAKHQGGKGARHADQVGILATQGIDPAVQRIDDPSRRAAHLHGLGQVPEPVEKAAHGGFGGHPAAPGAADSVGDRRHHLTPRLEQIRPDNGGGEILVLSARPFVGGESTLARTPAPPSLTKIAPAYSIGVDFAIATSFRQFALVVEKISAGRRRQHDREFARLAIERVAPTVLGVAPRNLRVGDWGGIGVDRPSIEVDRGPPGRSAGQIGAGDDGFARLGPRGENGEGERRRSNRGRGRRLPEHPPDHGGGSEASVTRDVTCPNLDQCGVSFIRSGLFLRRWGKENISKVSLRSRHGFCLRVFRPLL